MKTASCEMVVTLLRTFSLEIEERSMLSIFIEPDWSSSICKRERMKEVLPLCVC